METPIKNKLKKLVAVHGAAYVAVAMGLRDTEALKHWLYSSRNVPLRYHQAVKELTKETKKWKGSHPKIRPTGCN